MGGARLHGTPTQSWETTATIDSSWPLPLGDIHGLGRALSLVCDVAVEMSRIWLDYSEHAHFGQDICRLAILKRLRSKRDPVWESIVLGG